MPHAFCFPGNITRYRFGEVTGNKGRSTPAPMSSTFHSWTTDNFCHLQSLSLKSSDLADVPRTGQARVGLALAAWPSGLCSAGSLTAVTRGPSEVSGSESWGFVALLSRSAVKDRMSLQPTQDPHWESAVCVCHCLPTTSNLKVQGTIKCFLLLFW